MSSLNQVREGEPNSSDRIASTTIRRTVVERGVRPVENHSDLHNGQSATVVAITTITKQHEDEQRELQELNTKLSSYIDHVQRLENRNAELQAKLHDMKQQWVGDAIQLQSTYGPQLEALRAAIDDSLRDQAKQELQLKRHEYDIWHTQQLLAAVDSSDKQRLNALQQELNMAIQDLEQLRAQFDRRSGDVAQQRTNIQNALNELNGLQTELENHRLERIMVENELQTLREQLGFEDAVYQGQREELLSLATPVLDISRFYGNELARAISEIRQDFEVLSQSQVQELEEYYRVKTEHIQQTIAQEAERKRLLDSTQETIDKTSRSSTLTDLTKDYRQLQSENSQLQAQLDDIASDLSRIQEEHLREQDNQVRELNQLRDELASKQGAIDSLLGSNVSLRFELSTYRRLLNSEEQRLNQLEQQQPAVLSSSSTANQTQRSPSETKNTQVTMQKMAIKKSSQGAIVFDSVDFVNDSILITYDRSSGNEQSLGNWTLRHEVDQQTPKQYKLPSSFSLKPRQTVRILSRRSPQSARSGNDVLIADQIDTWGQGQVVVTRLIDANSEEKANITHTRVPA